MDIRYLLGIDPDRLLAPYLKEAGLFPHRMMETPADRAWLSFLQLLTKQQHLSLIHI